MLVTDGRNTAMIIWVHDNNDRALTAFVRTAREKSRQQGPVKCSFGCKRGKVILFPGASRGSIASKVAVFSMPSVMVTSLALAVVLVRRRIEVAATAPAVAAAASSLGRTKS